MRPVRGSSWPSSPASWAVNQTVPPGAGATSCGCAPATTGNSRSVVRGRRAGGAARPAAVAAWAVAVSRASGPPSDLASGLIGPWGGHRPQHRVLRFLTAVRGLAGDS